MKRRYTPLRLAGSAGRYYWHALVPLVMCTALIAGLTMVTAITSGSIERAARDSIAAHFSSRPHIMQPRSDDAIADGLGVESWMPLSDASAGFTANDRLVQGDLRTFGEGVSVAPGTLLDGRHPQASDEIVLTDRAAELLELGPGDTVSVTLADGIESERTVVGVSVDEAAADTVQGYAVGDLVQTEISAFLSDVDPFTDAATTVLFEDRKFTYTSLEYLSSTAVANAVASHFALGRALTLVLLALLLVLVGVTSGVFATNMRTPLQGVIAAGMSRNQRLVILSLILGPATAASAVIGALAAALVLWAFRVQYSGMFGQHWLGISVPVPAVVAVVLLPVVSAVLTGLRTGRVTSPRARPYLLRAPVDRPMAAGASLVSLVLVSFLLTLAANSRLITPEMPLLFVVLTVLAVPWLAASWYRHRFLTPTVRSATRAAASIAVILAMGAGLVTTLSAAHAARTVHDAHSVDAFASAMLPPGSMAVDSVPTRQAEALSEEYVRLGGAHLNSWIVPLEQDTETRVTTPEIVACMEETGSRSPLVASSSCGIDPVLRYVVLDPDAGDSIKVAPDVDTAGLAGFVRFNAGEIEISDSRVLDGVEIDETLVQPLAGAVIGKSSPLAEQWDIEASDLRQLVFVDFATLDPADQARMRALVSRSAPAAEVVEIAADPSAQRTLGLLLIGAIASVVAALVFMIGVRTVLSSMRETRMAMLLFHANRSTSARLAISVVGLWVLTTVASAAGGLLLAWLITAKDGLGSGWLWVVAPAVALLACLAAGVHWRDSLLNRTALNERAG